MRSGIEPRQSALENTLRAIAAAAVGGFFAGVISPGMVVGAMLLADHQIGELPTFWFVAVLAVGLPAFGLGAAGALLLRIASGHVGRGWVFAVGIALGAMLGPAVPLLASGSNHVIDLAYAVPAGVACACLVVPLLGWAKLLRAPAD